MKKDSDRAVIRVVIATGISSVVTQLLVIREVLTQFQGNEIVIALILFNWLATVRGGSTAMKPPMRFALGAAALITIGLAAVLKQLHDAMNRVADLSRLAS